MLEDYHRRQPLRAGAPREEVKSRLATHVPALTPRLFNDLVARAVDEGWLAETAGTVHRASHRAAFSAKQQQAVDYLFFTFRQNPYTTPSVAQADEMVGTEVLNALIEQGRLVKLSDEVILLAETYEEMRDRVVAFLRQNERITVAEVRDLFDTSRKYALALAGYLDEQRITRRVGDDRVLRGAPLLRRGRVETMKPTIDGTQFGSITVEGEILDHDIVIRLDGEVKKRKKKLSSELYGTSHTISLAEAEHIYDKGAERLIIGAGQYGYVKLSDEAAEYLARKSVHRGAAAHSGSRRCLEPGGRGRDRHVSRDVLAMHEESKRCLKS